MAISKKRMSVSPDFNRGLSIVNINDLKKLDSRTLDKDK